MRNRRIGMLAVGAVLSLAACGGAREVDDAANAGTGAEAATAALVGRWAYSATTWVEDGETKTLGIGGDLLLEANGHFQQNRRIGGISNTASGTWRVEGSLLHLDSTFTYALGEDAQGPTLTLTFESDGSAYTYALRKAG